MFSMKIINHKVKLTEKRNFVKNIFSAVLNNIRDFLLNGRDLQQYIFHSTQTGGFYIILAQAEVFQP